MRMKKFLTVETLELIADQSAINAEAEFSDSLDKMLDSLLASLPHVKFDPRFLAATRAMLKSAFKAGAQAGADHTVEVFLFHMITAWEDEINAKEKEA